MPKKYTLETLPKPNSKEVALVVLPVRRFAVIAFPGFPNDENIQKNAKILQAYVLAEKLNSVGEAVLAFYNPPWTLPFLRRNEVMMEI